MEEMTRRKVEKLISPRLRRKSWGIPQDLKGCNLLGLRV